MASIITHSLVGLGAALMMPKDWRTSIFLAVATIAPSLPDLDVLGFYAGIPYGSFWGHRGFIHSFCFAFLLSALLTIIVRTHQKTTFVKLWLFLGTIISTHGILDAMTTGGHGIALFSPWNDERIFLPWRVIQVSPMHLSQFFSEWGLEVLKSEMIYVWLPLFLLLFLVKMIKQIT
ncbi:MAG: metal-dependent hydrolase [Bacteroidia bacterium]